MPKKGQARNGYSKPQTICWKCRRATGGCSWSQQLQPVKGWEAVKEYQRYPEGPHTNETYTVLRCPEFIPDGKSRE